jgi:hypothetical protein
MITVKINDNRTPIPPTYPRLVRHKLNKDLIILFTSRTDVLRESGIVLQGVVGNYIGEYSSVWVEGNFEPFDGEITISNSRG